MKMAIGLDVGTKDIKLAILGLRGKRAELLELDIVDMPKASGKYEIIDTLKLILKNNPIEPNMVICLSIPAEQSFFKVISAGPDREKGLKEIIEEELRKNVAFSFQECIWDYVLLKYKEDDIVDEILLVAAKKEVILEKIKMVKQYTGLVNLVNSDILASYNCLRFNTNLSINAPHALIDISSKVTQVFIFDDKGNFWAWAIPFGGDKFTDNIAKNLGISFEEADAYKRKMLLEENTATEKFYDDSIGLMRQFVTELDKTLSYYYFQTSETALEKTRQKIDEILLSGGGSLYFGLDKFIINALNIPARYIYPFNRISIKDKIISSKKNILNTQSPKLTTAVGLALQGLNLAEIKINLIRKPKENFLQKMINKLFFKREVENE